MHHILIKILNFKIILFFLSLVFIPNATYSLDNIYFSSYEEVVIGNRLNNSYLNFMPVKKALMDGQFKEYHWILSLDKKVDQNQAIDHGIKAFLLKNGNTRVTSRSVKSGTKLYDETRSSFEGYFKNRVKIIDIKKSKKNNSFDFYFQAEFSPIAPPNRWNKILLKEKLISYYQNLKSFFIYD